MRYRLLLLICAGAFGTAVAVLPKLATANTSAVTAQGTSWVPQDSGVQDGTSLSFSSPGGLSHDLHFVDGPGGAAPTCNTPTSPTPVAWSGSCTFPATEGSYVFICDLHGHWDAATHTASGMWGTVHVNAVGTVPATTTSTTTTSATTTSTTTTGTTTTGTGTTTTPAYPGPGATTTGATTTGGVTGSAGGGLAAAAASDLQLPVVQRGGAVSGAVTIAVGGSSLEADLLGSGAQIARTVTAGKTTRQGLAAGKLRFRVALGRRAAAALRRRHRLALRLRVTVTAPAGPVTTLSRRVTLKGAANG